jgi:hypothetical protein
MREVKEKVGFAKANQIFASEEGMKHHPTCI